MCAKCAAQALTHNVATADNEDDGMAMLDYQPPIANDATPERSLVNNQAESDAALDAFRIKAMFGI
jgi:hypothetical protein